MRAARKKKRCAKVAAPARVFQKRAFVEEGKGKTVELHLSIYVGF